MKLSEKQIKFGIMLAQLINWASNEGYDITMGEVWRTKEQQAEYFRTGYSRVRHSKHQDRLAADINLFIAGIYITDKNAYRPLGEYWELLGGRWGGRFGVHKDEYDERIGWDSGHFEFLE